MGYGVGRRWCLRGLGHSEGASQASWDQSGLPPSREYLSAFLTFTKRRTVLKLAKIDSGKGRKAKWPTKGSSQTQPCLCGYHDPVCPHFLIVPAGGFPNKRGCFLLGFSSASKEDSALTVSGYHWIPYKLLSNQLCHAFSPLKCKYKKKLDRSLILPTKLVKVIWDKFLFKIRTTTVLI